MDYFIDRLETLNPRLKRTELVILLTTRLKTIRAIAGEREGSAPTTSEVEEMRRLADEMMAAATAPVSSEGKILNTSN
jgi:hypothetical protein